MSGHVFWCERTYRAEADCSCRIEALPPCWCSHTQRDHGEMLVMGMMLPLGCRHCRCAQFNTSGHFAKYF